MSILTFPLEKRKADLSTPHTEPPLTYGELGLTFLLDTEPLTCGELSTDVSQDTVSPKLIMQNSPTPHIEPPHQLRILDLL